MYIIYFVPGGSRSGTADQISGQYENYCDVCVAVGGVFFFSTDYSV